MRQLEPVIFSITSQTRYHFFIWIYLCPYTLTDNMELIINILFLPSFYFKAVACIKRKWFIEFRGIKINVEGVPEWTEWVSMLGVTARFSCVGLAVTKHYKQENKSKSTEILIFKMILLKKNSPQQKNSHVLFPTGQILGAKFFINFSMVIALWNFCTASTRKYVSKGIWS